MGNISPVNGIIEHRKEYKAPILNNGAQVFNVFKTAKTSNEITPQALNPMQEDKINLTQENKAASKEKKNKKPVPWKKIGLAIAAAALFIEFNLRRNPVRKKKIEEYTKIFSNTTGTEIRNFSMVPYRHEVLIREAADGSKKANELINEFDYDAQSIVKYIKIKRKIKKARQYYIEGRFEHFKTQTMTNKQMREQFFKELARLQKEADRLYEKAIVPLLKNR